MTFLSFLFFVFFYDWPYPIRSNSITIAPDAVGYHCSNAYVRNPFLQSISDPSRALHVHRKTQRWRWHCEGEKENQHEADLPRVPMDMDNLVRAKYRHRQWQ